MATATASEEHERRAARNQSLFRDVNERVSDVNKGHAVWVTLSDWICECADETCTDRIKLSLEQYERVREDPTRFVIAPGAKHVAGDVERVVERHERYWVVSKLGEAASIAIDRDPGSKGDGRRD